MIYSNCLLIFFCQIVSLGRSVGPETRHILCLAVCVCVTRGRCRLLSRPTHGLSRCFLVRRRSEEGSIHLQRGRIFLALFLLLRRWAIAVQMLLSPCLPVLLPSEFPFFPYRIVTMGATGIEAAFLRRRRLCLSTPALPHLPANLISVICTLFPQRPEERRGRRARPRFYCPNGFFPKD